MEAQERHRIKSRLPRTAEKVSKQRLKSEMSDLGIEFNSDSDDEVRTYRSYVLISRLKKSMLFLCIIDIYS